MILTKHILKHVPPSRSVRLPPSNHKDLEKKLYAHEIEKEIPGFNSFLFKNCLIINGLIVSLPFFRFHTALSSYLNYSLLKKIKLLKCLKKPGPILKEGIWITDNWSNNYFHWICDALPRLIMSNNQLNIKTVILPEHYIKHSYVSETLDLMGFSIQTITSSSSNLVRKLICTEHLAPSGNYYKKSLIELRDKLRLDGNKECFKRIYISREKASHRKIINESSIIPILKKHDFSVVYFEELDWLNQRQLLSETEVLMSIHGAGLTNMLLLPNNGKVIEIRNKDNAHDNCFFSLASELSIEYYLLPAEPIKSVILNTDYDQIDVMVDPANLDHFLTKYLR
jgi:capsular polysaccharide biosynthesis protein